MDDSDGREGNEDKIVVGVQDKVVVVAQLEDGVILSGAAFRAERRACPEPAEGISSLTGFASSQLLWVGLHPLRRSPFIFQN
jgi:hypothetical protein